MQDTTQPDITISDRGVQEASQAYSSDGEQRDTPSLSLATSMGTTDSSDSKRDSLPCIPSSTAAVNARALAFSSGSARDEINIPATPRLVEAEVCGCIVSSPRSSFNNGCGYSFEDYRKRLWTFGLRQQRRKNCLTQGTV